MAVVVEPPMIKCPVCGRELEAYCADSSEPFTAYKPSVGLLAYGPLDVEKQVLHEGSLDGFRVLHLYFPATKNEQLVVLPKPTKKHEEELHPVCKKYFDELNKAEEEYMKFCMNCCLELGCELAMVGGEELCPGCPCDEIMEDICEDEMDEWEEDESEWVEE